MILQAPEAQKNLFAEVVRGGALFWKLMAERSEAKGHSTPFYDEHSPDIRRFANILCLATGADPLRFIPMAVKAGIPENRLHRCAGDYKRRHAAWNELMEKYGKQGQGQDQDQGKGGGRMTLKIEPPRKAAYKPFEEEFRRDNFFQKLLDLMAKSVHLPRDVPVVVKECGMANAFWSPRAGEIILCYEMYAEIVQVFLAAAQGGDKPKGRSTPPAPQPRPGAGGPLVGTWQCQNNVVGSTEQLALGAGGSSARPPATTWAPSVPGGAGQSKAACSRSRSRATSPCNAACRARSTSRIRCPMPTRCRSAWRARRPGCASGCSRTCATAMLLSMLSWR
jgi:hypothetical protein